MIRLILLLFAFLLVVTTSPAQNSWSPPEALFTRPRILLGPADISRLQVRVGEMPFSDLYRGIWENATGPLPSSDTLSDSGRSANARLAKNLAFILITNRRPDGSTMIELSGEERDTIMARLGSAFERINVDVDPFDEDSWDDRGMELIDYKVRVLNSVGQAGGTGARVRVLIESRDAKGQLWSTVGVHANIIEASWEALVDAVEWRLLKGRR